MTVAVHVEPSRYPDRDRLLSEQRAEAVRAALEALGVPVARLGVAPMGSTRPLKRGMSERIELLLLLNAR